MNPRAVGIKHRPICILDKAVDIAVDAVGQAQNRCPKGGVLDLRAGLRKGRYGRFCVHSHIGEKSHGGGRRLSDGLRRRGR